MADKAPANYVSRGGRRRQQFISEKAGPNGREGGRSSQWLRRGEVQGTWICVGRRGLDGVLGTFAGAN